MIPSKTNNPPSKAAAVTRPDEEIGHGWVGSFTSPSAADPKGARLALLLLSVFPYQQPDSQNRNQDF
jgi:hypothetical protein